MNRPQKPDFVLVTHQPLVARFHNPEDDEGKMIQSEVLDVTRLVTFPANPGEGEPNMMITDLAHCLSPEGNGTIIIANHHPWFVGWETMLNAMTQMQEAMAAAERRLGGLFVPPGSKN